MSSMSERRACQTRSPPPLWSPKGTLWTTKGRLGKPCRRPVYSEQHNTVYCSEAAVLVLSAKPSHCIVLAHPLKSFNTLPLLLKHIMLDSVLHGDTITGIEYIQVDHYYNRHVRVSQVALHYTTLQCFSKIKKGTLLILQSAFDNWHVSCPLHRAPKYILRIERN